jgi:hypothetical protein
MARVIDTRMLKDITKNPSQLVKFKKALLQGMNLKDILPKLTIVG